MKKEMYESPLCSRYSSEYMLNLFRPIPDIAHGGGFGQHWPALNISWGFRLPPNRLENWKSM